MRLQTEIALSKILKIIPLIKRAVLNPSKIPLAAKLELRTLSVVLRYGLPDIMLQFLGGIGDELLLTAVAYELKRRNHRTRIWQVSHSKDLLENNPDYDKFFDWNYLALRYSHILDERRYTLSYSEEIIPGELEKPPDVHIIAELCRKAGIKGEIAIRPYVFLNYNEKLARQLVGGQIAVHCVGQDSYENVMRNKIWPKEKFDELVKIIKESGIAGKDLEIIQLGISTDPPIQGCIDLRGKTSLRETAAILSQSHSFIGTSGLLSHLARAVDCRSVIIYGGREHSYQTGYICNENLDSFVDCAPCWRWNECNYERKCMEMVNPEDVMNALKRCLDRKDRPLETDIVVI